MSWGRVDDRWFHHAKVVGTSLAARGLWTTALSWSCANRSPVIPPGMVTFLAGGTVDVEAAELVASGLWHAADHHCEACENPPEGGYVIHDWSDYQERTLSEKRAEAGARGGRAGTGDSKRRADSKQAASKSQASVKQTRKQVPDPTRPVPDTPTDMPTPDGDGGPLRLVTVEDVEDVTGRFEQFWTAYPRHHLSGRVAGGGNRKPALSRWRKLTRQQRDACLVAVAHYRAECEADRTRPVKHPEGWLAEERWETYAEPAVVRSRGAPAHAVSDVGEAHRFDREYWSS